MAQTAIKLSKDTLDVIKNLSSINNSMRFKPGNVLKTMSACESILMEAEIDETIPQEFSIYELNKFLNVLGLPTLKDAELVFEDDKKVTIKGGASSVNYHFTDQTFVMHPDKTITLPSVELQIKLNSEVLDGFEKAAAALGHKIMAFRVVAGKGSLVATTPELDTSNDYVVDLGDVVTDAGAAAPDGFYKLKVENLKILPGDYTFSVCAKGIIKAEHLTRKVTYFLGLERV